MAKLNPYLNFKGRTEEAFDFYKSVFGGDFPTVMRYKDTPDASRFPAEVQDKIMHIALPIGENVLMGNDALEATGHTVTEGTNITLSVSADSREDADKFFNGLAAGGRTTLPMQQQFWGAYFGMLTDKFGINWMVSFDQNFA